MALSSQQIVDMITRSDGTPLGAGANLYASRSAQRPGSSLAQRKFAEAMARLNPPAGANAAAATKYNHPGAAAAPTADKRGPLTPVELAWLQRLPEDPSAVSWDDAHMLARLAASFPPSSTQNTMDARLVASHWAPVKDFHDANAARISLANTQAVTPPPIPSEALPALAEAIAAENPGLTDTEALGRASTMLAAASQQRAAGRDARLARARDALTAINDRATQRQAAVKPAMTEGVRA